MERNTDLQSLMFPVELRDVYVDVPVGSDSPGRSKQMIIHEPRHRAVVNTMTNHIFSVVTDEYKLISNLDAFEIARRIFGQLFHSTNPKEMEVFNIITSEENSYCHIDIIHNTYRVNIWKTEIFIPFIRATNSYNRHKTLGFDIGFVRKLCSNGIIFEGKTVKLRYLHSGRGVINYDNIVADVNQLHNLEELFKQYMDKIKEKMISRNIAFATMQSVLQLKFDVQHKNPKIAQKNQERLENFVNDFDRIYDSYKQDYGESAYTLFNTMTEYCREPRKGIINNNQIDAMQKRSGVWLKSIGNEN